MFTISPSGILTDYMGFPLNASELQEIFTAYQKSTAQSGERRIQFAQEHCKTSHPEMFKQLNWEVFK